MATDKDIAYFDKVCYNIKLCDTCRHNHVDTRNFTTRESWSNQMFCYETIAVSTIREGDGPTAFVVPGWTGNGRDAEDSPSQFRPFFGGALAKYPTIKAIDFTAAGAPGEAVAREMAHAFRSEAQDGEQLTIMSASHGAQATIRALEFTFFDLRAILIDPPAGGKSLVQVALPPVTWLAKKIGKLPPGADKGFPQWLFNKLFCPGLSDKDPIEVPDSIWSTKDEKLIAEYVDKVHKDAFDGQQGFPLTLCAWQLGEMARAADDPSYLKACRIVNRLYGKNIVRIISTRNNAVVNPAVSDPFYRIWLPDALRVEALTNHFDVAQRSEFWNELIAQYV